MSDAADDVFDAALRDVFDAALREHEMVEQMLLAGARRCTEIHGEDECPICLDFGWIDKDGNPCEP